MLLRAQPEWDGAGEVARDSRKQQTGSQD
jgi:hypothetical protein